MKVKGTPDNLSPGELRQYYDRRFARRPLRAREGFYSWIASKVPPSAGSTVLDVACGGGYLLKELQAKAGSTRGQDKLSKWHRGSVTNRETKPNSGSPGSGLYGSDISAQALRIARNEAPEAKFVLADAEKLPFPDASFDMVYNLGSLEHFLDMETALREMHRIMRPDAKSIVMVPNSRYIGDIWRRLTFRGGADHHQLLERFGTLKEWKALLESNGFRVESVFAYNKFKPWLKVIPLPFAYCFIFTCTPL